MSSKICRNLKKSSNDIIYTPKIVALKMIEFCEIKEGDKVLDPSKGGGVFYDNLPKNCIKSYCEITENKDFFAETGKYDLIIGNPPYSKWDKWLYHTMTLTDKFCYIFGFLNFTDKRIRDIQNKGYGIVKIHLLKIDYWFSQSIIVVFEKNKQSLITVEPNPIYCNICNKRCNRGRNGNSANICCPK